MVVLPAPDGAENMMSLPFIKEFQVSSSKLQVNVIASHCSEAEMDEAICSNNDNGFDKTI